MVYYEPVKVTFNKVLVIALLLSWHQAEAFHCPLSSKKLLNKMAKQHHRGLTLSFCQLWTEWLGKTLPIAEFPYNNAKNASTGHTPFELNYDYYLSMTYKDDVKLCFKSKSVDKLSAKLKKLIIVCFKNLYHA